MTSFAAGFANSAVSTDRVSRSPTAGPTSKHPRDPLPKLMAHCRANASPVACAQDWQGREAVFVMVGGNPTELCSYAGLPISGGKQTS
jgi:hypothetical protein